MTVKVTRPEINMRETLSQLDTHYKPGHVVQIQSSTQSGDTQWSNTSTSFTDVTNASVTITPKFTSSKIFWSVAGDMGASGSNSALKLRLMRNIGDSDFITLTGSAGAYLSGAYQFLAMQFVDLPNTTSPCTYKLQGALSTGNGTGYYPTNWSGSGGWTAAQNTNTMVVMEIAQ